jgi:hypothetical protein
VTDITESTDSSSESPKNSQLETQTLPTPTTSIVSSKTSSATPVSLARPTKNRKLALDTFEDSVGGRQALVEALSLSSLDKKQEHLLHLLSDPAREHDGLATIARDAGINPGQILDLFRNAAFAKAHAISLGKLSESLPNIMDDLISKSVDAEVQCPECRGEQLGESQTCFTCHGRGTIMRSSDIDRQKVALEVSSLLKKGGGVNVNVNQAVGIVQPGSFFSRYVKDSDAAAYDVDTIDAEPVTSENPK